MSGYDTLAGTSMASPQVAGVAALLSGQGLSNAQIVERLKETSSNHGLYEPVMGYGIVDADAATASSASAIVE
jgi:thermitase